MVLAPSRDLMDNKRVKSTSMFCDNCQDGEFCSGYGNMKLLSADTYENLDKR